MDIAASISRSARQAADAVAWPLDTLISSQRFVQLALLLELRCITMHDMESQLTIRLPADLSEALARATRKSGLRTSDIVRTALRDYLNTPSTSGPRPAERVRGLIGSLDSGIPDLAEQHREYVIESLKRGK